MVEKVFISPNRVRAYGNIVNMKTGDDFTLVNSELTVTTDMVDGAEMTVFQFGVEGGISIALVSSASACYVGDNVLLTATVLDDNTPVEAAEVTFKVGETVLGTDETDANGVATYTYTTSSAGSLSFSATYQDSTSNSVSVTVNHSYSLAFSQATYTASGGSATLECTLLEDNVAKSGASITVSGSDGSVYNGITNSSGVASVTVSNVSTATTFTASYSNVSDTCTVTVTSYLFYDDCSADNTSQYTNFYEIWGATTTVHTSLTFDTDHYVLTNSNASFSAVCLPVSAGLDNLKLTAKIRLLTNSTDKGGGVGVATKKEKGLAIFQPNGTSKHLILNNYQGAVSSNVAVNNLSTNDYNTFELIKSGQSLTFSIYDANGTQRFTKQITVATNTDYSNCIPCINVAKSDSVYIKEIKLESL